MKKFKFSLETVLSYKLQVLDSLQAEHAAVIAQVHDQEEKLTELHRAYEAYSLEYRQRCADGLEIREVLSYQAGLRAREREIEQETAALSELRKQEEQKRSEVVAAKQDTSSLEKLQDKKRSAYNAAVTKHDEQFIEEFVSSKWNSTAV